MPRSNFGRFKDGLSVAGLAMQVPHTGKTFYVCNSTTAAELQPLGIAGSDGNDGLTPERPLATIDAAINKCSAGRGDTIIVMPGHAETVANATTIIPDVSHVRILGLGEGEKRPIITFATATTANIPVSGANTEIAGLVFKCNIASQVAMITTTATDVHIHDCEFREGTAVGLNNITIGAADGDSDRAKIHDCEFYTPTASNGDHAIEFLKDMVGVRLERLKIDGNYDEGGILLPAAADACLDLVISDCIIRNTLSGIAAISISGTGCTGIIRDTVIRTDDRVSALDSGSLVVANVTFADETDQISASPVILAGHGGFIPGLGYVVTKTEDMQVATTDALFDVTGKSLITSWSVDVTAALDANVTDYAIAMTTTNKVLLAAGNIASSAAGHMFQLGGDSAKTALNTSTGAVSVTGSSDNAGMGLAMRVVGRNGGVTDVLKSTRTADAATGVMVHILTYLPLEAAAKITRAA